MQLYRKIYEFAASAGALEGYVYSRKQIDMKATPIWVDNLLDAYLLLPSDVRDECQPSCDQTIGRAIRSLIPLLGESHEIVQKLKSMVKGAIPETADDFQKTKWFQG